MKSIKTKLLIVVWLFFLPLTLVASEQKMEWKKVKDKDGIKVYRAHSEESKFKTFKAVTKIELEKIQSFVALMMDNESMVKWLHMVTGSELIATDDPRRHELYIETRLPWPVADRFTKSDVVLSQGEDYAVKFELYEPARPAEPRAGFILAPVSKGYYQVTPIPDSKAVEVEVELFVDPGGYVSAFLVNLITDDMSYYTMQKFRKVIQSEKYQNYSTDLVERRPWIDSIPKDETQSRKFLRNINL